jgi:hypothetical protein
LFDPVKFGHAEALHVLEHASSFVLFVTSK